MPVTKGPLGPSAVDFERAADDARRSERQVSFAGQKALLDSGRRQLKILIGIITVSAVVTVLAWFVLTSAAG